MTLLEFQLHARGFEAFETCENLHLLDDLSCFSLFDKDTSYFSSLIALSLSLLLSLILSV
jgi:hypothetical protein